jgi:hypothetical protein
VLTPVLDPTIIVWYDATGLVTNTDNAYGTVTAADEVVTWKNLKSDATYDATNAVTAEQPILDNILKKITFDGSNDNLRASGFDLNSPITFFLTGSRLNNTLAPYMQMSHSLAGANSLDIINTSTSVIARAQGYSAPPQIVNASIPVSQQFAIAVHWVPGNDPTWYTQYYDDVTNPASSIVKTVSTGDMVEPASGEHEALYFGRAFAGSSFLNCELNEAFFFNRELTEDEGISWLQYLINKWG